MQNVYVLCELRAEAVEPVYETDCVASTDEINSLYALSIKKRWKRRGLASEYYGSLSRDGHVLLCVFLYMQ